MEKEMDLYPIVKNFFECCGYEVKSEVCNCDVAAYKDGEMIVTELKLKLNLEVILQATERQKIAQAVYIAVPNQKHNSRLKKIKHLLRRLEIGLIFVGENDNIKVILEATPFDRIRSQALQKKKSVRLEKEFLSRVGDHNIGGSSKVKIMSSYRQRSLKIAQLLSCNGESTPKQLRTLGACDNTTSILYQNHYGWFENVKRGVYTLTPSGFSALDEYKDMLDEMDTTKSDNLNIQKNPEE